MSHIRREESGSICCFSDYISELEADNTELEAKYGELEKEVSLRTSAADLRHGRAIELEKKLEIAVKALDELGKGGYHGASFISREALSKIKSEGV